MWQRKLGTSKREQGISTPTRAESIKRLRNPNPKWVEQLLLGWTPKIGIGPVQKIISNIGTHIIFDEAAAINNKVFLGVDLAKKPSLFKRIINWIRRITRGR